MALTDTFVKNVKHTGAPAGDKHTDGHGMFLLVKAAGKYWRHSYRFLGKQMAGEGKFSSRAAAARHIAENIEKGVKDGQSTYYTPDTIERWLKEAGWEPVKKK